MRDPCLWKCTLKWYIKLYMVLWLVFLGKPLKVLCRTQERSVFLSEAGPLQDCSLRNTSTCTSTLSRTFERTLNEYWRRFLIIIFLCIFKMFEGYEVNRDLTGKKKKWKRKWEHMVRKWRYVRTGEHDMQQEVLFMTWETVILPKWCQGDDDQSFHTSHRGNVSGDDVKWWDHGCVMNICTLHTSCQLNYRTCQESVWVPLHQDQERGVREILEYRCNNPGGTGFSVMAVSGAKA